ncbi:hypothetical protein DRW07_14485 [Alteromonas sediminis]|uniref:Uncharacterized protein n=1 Tax=Alteromonas sediminis TaxID=2259342 RepID=A0A3N5XZ58_9ALTE|nr:hypothetical protein [Alteromonas sediminis]RPJ66010.1 hypothetical protein DRW07_14485 [Alteromonas sediminis]
MIRFVKVMAVLVLLAFVGMGSVALLVFEDAPRVMSNTAQQLDNAEVVDSLLKQVQDSISNRDYPSRIKVTDLQLESLQGALRRARLDVNGDVNTTSELSILRGSLALGNDANSHFINVEIWLKEGEGLTVDQVTIGNLTLPGSAALFFFEQGVNLYTNSKAGSELMSSVQRVDLEVGEINVGLKPLAPLLAELRKMDTGSSSPEDTLLAEQTAMYLRVLEAFEKERGVKARSLSDYLQRVFEVAAQRSSPQNAAIHNKAAILSLAVFAGHYRIGNFIGDIQPNKDKPLSPNHWPTLAGRVDLTRHFIISAALKLLSKQGVSLAIGEFKELMDRAEGGSGYSFVDLAADRAGVRFAVEAVDVNRAWAFQQHMKQAVTEDLFFPSISGLQEGYSKQAFTEKFGSVDSNAYSDEVAKIQARIDALPIYISVSAKAN